MGTALEEAIYNGMYAVFGNAVYLGLLVLGFFLALVFIRNFRLDAKIAIMLPASILAMAFIQPLYIVIALISSVIMYLGFNKIFNRQ